MQASAQDNSDIDPNVDGDLSAGRCISKGNVDFILFLRSIIWSDGLEGYTAIWEDVLYKNQCQANDIISLINQQDKIERYIRDAFLTCNTQKLPNMKRAYSEINAELYYVRNIVDGSVVVNLPYDVLTYRFGEDGEALFTSRNKIYADMKERYVDSGQFAKTEFDVFFNRLELKYEDKKKSYIFCENSSWSTVSDKWDEFIKTAGGVAPAWEKLEKGVGGRVEKLVESLPDSSFDGFLDGLVQLNINNQDAATGYQEIYDDLSYYSPEFGSSGPTYGLLLGAIESEEFNDTIENMQKIMNSRFEALYKEGSDATVEAMVSELDNLNSAIVDGLPAINKVYSCVETMNNRQCSGN